MNPSITNKNAVESITLEKPMALEIPMSKWTVPLESPIDSARGVISRRNLVPYLKPLAVSALLDITASAQKSPPFRRLTGSWEVSPPATAQVPSSPASMTSSGDQINCSVVRGRFKCVCGNVCERKDDFYDHYANSCVSKSNTCSICNRSFARSQDLKHHMSVHTFQTVTCNGCGFKFSRKQALNRHKKHCKNI